MIQNSDNDEYYYDGFDESPYAGTYVHDVQGWSDAAIDSAIDAAIHSIDEIDYLIDNMSSLYTDGDEDWSGEMIDDDL